MTASAGSPRPLALADLLASTSTEVAWLWNGYPSKRPKRQTDRLPGRFWRGIWSVNAPSRPQVIASLSALSQFPSCVGPTRARAMLARREERSRRDPFAPDQIVL